MSIMIVIITMQVHTGQVGVCWLRLACCVVVVASGGSAAFDGGRRSGNGLCLADNVRSAAHEATRMHAKCRVEASAWPHSAGHTAQSVDCRLKRSPQPPPIKPQEAHGPQAATAARCPGRDDAGSPPAVVCGCGLRAGAAADCLHAKCGRERFGRDLGHETKKTSTEKSATPLCLVGALRARCVAPRRLNAVPGACGCDRCW